MADQYADAINEATAAIRKAMRRAPTAEQRGIWLAMLERVVLIETMEERRNG